MSECQRAVPATAIQGLATGVSAWVAMYGAKKNYMDHSNKKNTIKFVRSILNFSATSSIYLNSRAC